MTMKTKTDPIASPVALGPTWRRPAPCWRCMIDEPTSPSIALHTARLPGPGR